MDFLVLGPLEVREGDRRLPLGGGRVRTLLGILLVHVNEVVASERLIDALWEGHPPETAAKALQGHVAQLRKLLAPGLLLTESPGYVLRVDPERIDAYRFARLVEEAARSEREEAARALREALALRRGPPYADFAYHEFARQEALRLEELELAALEARIDADLALGRHAALVGELDALVARHPLRERLRAQQMVALYRSGRQADALEAYADARGALDELGLLPGQELRRLHKAILAQDPALAAPPSDALSQVQMAPRVPRIPRRRRTLIALGGLLLTGAITAAVVESMTGTHSPAVVVNANSLAVLDPVNGRVVGDIAVGTRPVAVAVGYGGVWVANADDATVSRIDAKTHTVHTIGVGAEVSDLTTGFGSVWVANGNDGTITQIDPRTDAVEATLDHLGGGSELVLHPVFLIAADRRYLWATRGTRLLRIDPTTDIVKSIDIGETPIGLTAGGGEVWVTTLEENLLRIQPAAVTVSGRASLPTQGLAPVFERDALWLIANLRRGDVTRFDPGSLTQTVTVPIGGTPSDLAVGEGAIWAANGDGAISKIDLTRAAVTAVTPVGHNPSALAVGYGAVWVGVVANGA